jgi:DnaJ-class molecular chaperone
MDLTKYYTGWLSIPLAECPPTYYRLLSLPMSASAAEVQTQADQLTASLSQQLAGEHAAAAVEVLQKVVEAKTTLMDPAAKASYDQQLSGGASAILSSNSGGEKPLPRRPAVAGGEI